MAIRKFFDTGAEGSTGGGGEEISVGGRFTLGDIVTGSDAEPTPAPAPAKAEEPTPAPAPATEPVKQTETPATEPVKNTEPAKAEEPAKVEEKPEPAKPAEVDLKEVLSNRDRREVLEAMGLDPLFIDMLDYHQNTGDLKGYLDIKTKDWDAVSAEQLMRDKLKAEYGDLSEEDFEAICEDELNRKYAIGEDFTDDEKRLGKIRMEREAKKIRDEKKAEQAGFKVPEPKQSEEAQLQKAAREQAEREYNSFVEMVNTDEVTKGLLKDNKVVIGSGDMAYNFEVKGQDIIESIVDTNKLFANCLKKDESGNVIGYDLNKAYKLAAFAQNMDAYEKAYFDFAQSKVNKELVDELINPESKQGTAPTERSESQAQAFVTRGVHTSLGSILGSKG